MPSAAKNHGKQCPCQVCAMLRQGWTLIAPDGTVLRGL